MHRLRALIFDVDGTLADTEGRGHLIAFNRAFTELGLPWAWKPDEYTELLKIGGGKERLHHYIAQQQSDLAPEERGELVKRIHALKTQRYKEIVATGGIPLRNGVRRLLKEARASGIPLAIATTSSQEAVAALLERTLEGDAMSWFQCVAAGDIVVHKKPAPDIYRVVLARLKIDPKSAVVFEDSEAGVQSAAAASLPVVATPSEFTRHHDFSGAVAVLDHLGDPDKPCRQFSGCVDLQPMVTLGGLARLLESL